MFHNNRDGSFTKITNNAVVSEARDWRQAAWADYDNDGHLDLFATSTDANGFAAENELFRNNGDGTFTKMAASSVGAVVPGGGGSEGVLWADYDRDGFLDLFVSRYGIDWLFRNNGDGTFSRINNAAVGLVADNRDSYGGMWGDYDNDGWPDLYVPVVDSTGINQTNFFYRNNGNGTFTRILTGSLATDNGFSFHCAWADYDNDGDVDLFVTDGWSAQSTNSLYRNNGDGTFTKLTSALVGSIVGDRAVFGGCVWGDYDNDGWLDLFVATFNPRTAFIYHNNRDGTFQRVLTGSPANDISAEGSAGSWGDYDNDGFLDLFVSRGGHTADRSSLYHNNGNSNAWIKVKLVGTVSNRSAIGAKIRVRATSGGQTFWQLREINGGGSTSPLQAHFGLGDATNIDVLRIEWPSGIVQTMTNVAAMHSLTITEPAQLFSSRTNDVPAFTLKGGRGFQYDIEASSDFVTWTSNSTVTITNLRGTAPVIDGSTTTAGRFYRAVLR